VIEHARFGGDVPRSPSVDLDLSAFRLELATSLTAQGWGNLETVCTR
jgi:hypothetical protein